MLIWDDTAPFKGPQPWHVCCFWNCWDAKILSLMANWVVVEEKTHAFIDPKTNRRPTPTLSAPQSVYEYSAPKSHAKSTLPRQTLSTLSTFNSRKKIIGKIPAVRRKKRLDITYWLMSVNICISIRSVMGVDTQLQPRWKWIDWKW